MEHPDIPVDKANVIIIGAGVAGLTAAIYAARAELRPLAFAGDLEHKGGLLTKTSLVENFPGFPDGCMGFDLMVAMEQQAQKCGARIVDQKIVGVSRTKEGTFVVTDDTGQIHKTHTIIVATGSTPNKLGLPQEDAFWARGISSCAVCDGALFRGKRIVVVGGGDSAMEEAMFLTKFSHVLLIHRRDTFRASKVMQSRVLANTKITVRYSTRVLELEGNDKGHLQAIVVENVVSGQTEKILTDGLFYGLGLTPSTSLFRDFVDCDTGGYILRARESPWETMTSMPGIFVAGDAHDQVYRQAIVASGDGCKAAMDVCSFLEHHHMTITN